MVTVILFVTTVDDEAVAKELLAETDTAEFGPVVPKNVEPFFGVRIKFTVVPLLVETEVETADTVTAAFVVVVTGLFALALLIGGGGPRLCVDGRGYVLSL